MLAPTHSHVLVVVQRAQGLRVKGKNGTNDCYVTIALGKDKFMTSVQEKTLEPLWHEECELAIPKRGNVAVLVLTVHHRNKLGIDDFLGEACVPLNTLDFHAPGRNRWYRLMGRGGKEDGKTRGEIEVKIGFTYHERPNEEDHHNFLGVPDSEGRGSFGSLADDAASVSGKKKSPSLLNVSAKVAHQFGGSLMNLGKKVKRKASSNHKKNKRKDSDAMSESAFSSNADPGVNSDSEEDEAFRDEIASTVSAASSGAGYDGAHQQHTPSSSHKFDTHHPPTLHEDMASDAFYRRLEYDDFYDQSPHQQRALDVRRSVEPSPSVTREPLSARRGRLSDDLTSEKSTPGSGKLKDFLVEKQRSPSDTFPRAKAHGHENSSSGTVVASARGRDLSSLSGVGDDDHKFSSLRSSAQPSPVVPTSASATATPNLSKPSREDRNLLSASSTGAKTRSKSPLRSGKDDAMFSSTPCIPAIIASNASDDGSVERTPAGTPDGSRRNSATKGTRERFLKKFNVKEMLRGSGGGGDSKNADEESCSSASGQKNEAAVSSGHKKSTGSSSSSGSAQHKPAASSSGGDGAITTTIENGEERIVSKPASRHPLSVQQRFANMQRDDLIALIMSYENEAKQRENRIRDTEEYLDALLLRVMEASPFILSHGFSPAELSASNGLNNKKRNGLAESCRQEVKNGRFKLF